MSNNPLDQYCLVYEVTSLPHVLFASKVNATEPLEFNEFVVPAGLSAQPIEVRISIYDDITGDLVELSSDMMPASPGVIRHALNLTPLKMVQNLIQKLTHEAQRLNAVSQRGKSLSPHQDSKPQDSSGHQYSEVHHSRPPQPLS